MGEALAKTKPVSNPSKLLRMHRRRVKELTKELDKDIKRDERFEKKTKTPLAFKTKAERDKQKRQDVAVDEAKKAVIKAVEGRSGVPTKELVNVIFNFCLVYSGVSLYDYQAQFAKRIIRSILVNDGDEITALFSRQSGKSETVSVVTGGLSIILPVLAELPMFQLDERIQPFKNGITIGIFAPSLNQAQIVFGRCKKRMGSKSAQAVMSDPEIGVTFHVSNGQNVELSIGSIIRCQSASDNANIEGDSYHLIIVDESQDVGNYKYRKSISPMGAFYNATKVLIGTPTTSKGFFYNAIQRNKMEYAENNRKRNHFEYNYETIIKYNPKYAKYIAGEKKRLGEKSDEFRLSYKLEWILSRGMFITDEEFEKLKSTTAKWQEACRFTCVAGLDLAKQNDSTVLSIGLVDFENPIVIERSSNNPDDTYTAYAVELIALYDLYGNDYEQQFYEILDILSRYNIVKLVMDATGVGSPIFDRLKANTRYNIEPFVYGSSTKSALYKHFDGEAKSARFSFPDEPEGFVGELEYSKFEKEMLDLQKFYKGQNMVCCHPDEQGAHDDYPDSVALMLWGAREKPIGTITTSNVSPFKGRNSRASVRNKFTARRAG